MAGENGAVSSGASGGCVSGSGISVYFREYGIKLFYPENVSPGVSPVAKISTLLEYTTLAELQKSDPFSTGLTDNKPLVNEKWVYVFKKRENFVSLSYEVQVTAAGETQQFQCVNWAGTSEEIVQRWGKTYPRKAGSQKNSLKIDNRNELYIFVSQEQLTFSRIQEYVSDPVLLPTRALHLPANVCFKQEEPVDIVLVDFIGMSADLLQPIADRNSKRDGYNKQKRTFNENPDNVARLDYANMVKQLADKYPKVKENVEYDQIKKFINEKTHAEQLELLSAEINMYASFMIEFIATPWYATTLRDYANDPELLKVILEHTTTNINELGRCAPGTTYLVAEINNPNSWLNMVTEDPKVGFVTVFPSIRKTAAGVDAVVTFNLAKFKLSILAAIKDETRFLIDAEKAKWESDELWNSRKIILDKIRSYKNSKGPRGGKKITGAERARLVQFKLKKMMKKFEIPDCSVEKVTFITEKTSAIIYDAGLNLKSNRDVKQAIDAVESLQEKAINDAVESKLILSEKFKDDAFGAHQRALEINERKKNLESIGRFPALLVECLDHVNFILSAKELTDTLLDGSTADKSFAVLNAVGSFIDAAVHYESLVKTIFSKNIDNTTAAMVKAGRHTSTYIIKESAEKILFRRLDIASSAIDTILAGYNVYKYISKGQYRQVWGDAIAGVGYLLSSVVGGAVICELLGAEAIVALGIGTGGWGLIAVGLIVAGNIIAFLLREQPLRDWAEKCYFNKNQINYFNNEKADNLNKNTRMLIEKFSDFKVCPYMQMNETFHCALPSSWYDYTVKGFTVHILPGMYQPGKSKLYLTIDAMHDRVYPLDNVTILKETVCIDSKNGVIGYKDGDPEKGIEYIHKCWTIDELVTIAKKNAYYTDKFETMVNEWKTRVYSFDSSRQRIAIENRYSFHATIKARLDFNGVFKSSAQMNQNYEATTEMVFPIKTTHDANGSVWAMSQFKEKTTFDHINRMIVR